MSFHRDPHTHGGHHPPGQPHHQGLPNDPKLHGVPPTMQAPHRVGGWLPQDHRVLQEWLKKHIDAIDLRAKQRTVKAQHSVIKEFQALIEGDTIIYMGFHQMFEQVPHKPPYCHDPTGKPQVRDYKLMLDLFNDILSTAPEYQDNALVGFPINAIIDWPMGTPAGYQMFTIESVNKQFKKLFDVWVKFLTHSDSCYVLNEGPGGWFSPLALEAMPNFVQDYVCEPEEPYWGFTSWDHFFTREFRQGVRPVEFPQNDIITSACESTIYCREFNVQARDTFWLKNQPYSLVDMLYFDDLVPQFVGGTVYQAFLAATKYHRWHSPVNGIIKRVVNVPGTYYAESPVMGLDPAAPDMSQAFITTMAARAIIFIEGPPPVGLMCFMAVGMSEVSSCEVTVQVGDNVQKGDQLGMFHFGGSTHCLIFRPETKVTFPDDQPIGTDILLNAPIATVHA